MIGYLDRLKLRPNERRFVVLVFLVVFLVLNLFFVWPHFTDLGDAQYRLEKARQKYALYQAETNRVPDYQARLRKFEDENPTVPQEDQAIQLLGTIQSQVALSGVGMTGASRQQTKTNNEFFLEQLQTITIQGRDPALVNFLYNVSAGESLIRVRELSLRPDPPRQSIGGNVTLVASYQRKPPAKGGLAKSSATRTNITEPTAGPKPGTPAAGPAVKPPPTRRTSSPTAGVKTAGTNSPAATSWWSKVTGLLSKSSTTPAPKPQPTVKPSAPIEPKK